MKTYALINLGCLASLCHLVIVSDLAYSEGAHTRIYVCSKGLVHIDDSENAVKNVFHMCLFANVSSSLLCTLCTLKHTFDRVTSRLSPSFPYSTGYLCMHTVKKVILWCSFVRHAMKTQQQSWFIFYSNHKIKGKSHIKLNYCFKLNFCWVARTCTCFCCSNAPCVKSSYIPVKIIYGNFNNYATC